MKRKPATFRIDPKIKAEFQANCKDRGYTMGIMLEVMMEKYNARQKYFRKIEANYELKLAIERMAETKGFIPK